MNLKFNLGTVDVNVPAGEMNPEMNLAIRDVTYEITDLSLTEYGAVIKTVVCEANSMVKDFGKLHEESKQRDFEREQMRHEMRMQELKAQREATLSPGTRKVTTSSQKQQQFDNNFV
jgi:hypothetical protein